MRYKADSELFEVVTVFGREALFSCNRIERDSVPKGLYRYEVRHDDCCQGIPCEVAKGILVNFWGTLLTRTEISEVEREGRRYIMDDEWEGGSASCTLCFLASNFPHFHRYDSLKSALYIHAVSKNINTFPKNQGRIRAAIAVEILDFTVMYR